MKAAVKYQKGALPQYADFAEPVPQNDHQVLVTVKAVAIKHFDKGRASGSHYSAEKPKSEGRVIGSDGVCVLEDGTRVYAIGSTGMLAEQAVIEKDRMVVLPTGIDDATAAALPNAVIGSAMGLRFKAGIQPGDIVLINGATGFTGRVAVQIAKHYGAVKIIVTGRNQQSFEDLLKLGADEIITLSQNDDEFIAQVKKLNSISPINIILDYLWGRSAGMIFAALKGDGSFTAKIRFVSVGSVTGDLIQLSAANLRSADLQLTGSGLGSWSREQVRELFRDILPEIFQLAVDGKLKIETTKVKLKDISLLWNLDIPNGARLVVTI